MGPKKTGIRYKIRNWTQFQHYKKRKPPWIKLHRELLNDYDLNQLPPTHFKLLMQLWLLASEASTLDGALPSIQEISYRLHVPQSKVLAMCKHLASTWLEPCKHESIPSTEEEYRVQSIEEERDCGLPKSPPKKPRKKSTPLTEPFMLTTAMQEWAEQNKIGNVKEETAQFCDFHRAKGSSYKDWTAAWRTWMRNSVKFNKGAGNGQTKTERNVEQGLKNLAEFAADERPLSEGLGDLTNYGAQPRLGKEHN